MQERMKAMPKTSRPRGGVNKPTKRVFSSVPQKIRIRRKKGYHTDHIGVCEDGTQFMAFIVAVPNHRGPRSGDGKVKWYAVLHHFDADGKHIETKALFLGTKRFAHQLSKAEAKRDGLIRELGPLAYGDIEVGLFTTRIDGNIFGLVDASERKENYERIDLVPNDLAFFPPWDGTYDT